MNCTPNHLHLSFKPGMVQLILDLPAGNAEANLTSTRLPSCSKDNFPWLEAKQARRFKLPTMGSTVKPKAGGLLVRKGSFGKTSVTIIGMAFTINLNLSIPP